MGDWTVEEEALLVDEGSPSNSVQSAHAFLRAVVGDERRHLSMLQQVQRVIDVPFSAKEVPLLELLLFRIAPKPAPDLCPKDGLKDFVGGLQQRLGVQLAQRVKHEPVHPDVACAKEQRLFDEFAGLIEVVKDHDVAPIKRALLAQLLLRLGVHRREDHRTPCILQNVRDISEGDGARVVDILHVLHVNGDVA